MKKLFTALLLLLAGCAVIPLNQGSERVRVLSETPGIRCKLLGDITGSQGDFLRGVWTSNADLDTGARNDLKNKAAAMGGNVVTILTQRAGQTGGGWGGSGYQTNVTITGNVYNCPNDN